VQSSKGEPFRKENQKGSPKTDLESTKKQGPSGTSTRQSRACSPEEKWAKKENSCAKRVPQFGRKKERQATEGKKRRRGGQGDPASAKRRGAMKGTSRGRPKGADVIQKKKAPLYSAN